MIISSITAVSTSEKKTLQASGWRYFDLALEIMAMKNHLKLVDHGDIMGCFRDDDLDDLGKVVA